MKIFTLKPLIYIMAFLFFSIQFTLCQTINEANYKTAKSNQLSKNKGDTVVEIARSFLGKPYKAYTLEENGEERLIVNLTEFDCSTLVEQCIAIANSTDYDSFKKELTKLRYRNGKIDGYGSRLHYLTDWLASNQQNSELSLETQKMGGEIYNKRVNFMTTHWDKYPKANTDKIKKEIITSEKAIAQRKFYFIPKIKIDSLQHLIKNGDIIAITTSIAGLDCSHQGFAIWQGKYLHLLHASSSKKKVIISEETLSNYLAKNKLQTGILVARLL
jgi:Protein of unknown function (DUF1460)